MSILRTAVLIFLSLCVVTFPGNVNADSTGSLPISGNPADHYYIKTVNIDKEYSGNLYGIVPDGSFYADEVSLQGLLVKLGIPSNHTNTNGPISTGFFEFDIPGWQPKGVIKPYPASHSSKGHPCELYINHQLVGYTSEITLNDGATSAQSPTLYVKVYDLFPVFKMLGIKNVWTKYSWNIQPYHGSTVITPTPTPKNLVSSNWTAYVTHLADSSTVTPINLATNKTAKDIPVGEVPKVIAITPDGKTAYVVNNGYNSQSGSVTPIDLATNKAENPIRVGEFPVNIAITPDRKTAYVVNMGDYTHTGSVTPIDLTTNKAEKSIPVGKSPMGVAITPNGKNAYVVNSGDNTVTPINLSTNTAENPISAGSYPQYIAIAPDGKTAYVTNWVIDTITPINLTTNTTEADIYVGGHSDRLGDIAITPDGRSAYVFRLSILTGAEVTRVNLLTKQEGESIPISISIGTIAITPDGKLAYVTTDHLTPIDLTTNTIGKDISTGHFPGGIAIAPDQAPVASFKVMPAPLGKSTTFDASASTDTTTIIKYAWNFGDGHTAVTNKPTISHIYASAGSFKVTLTETDAAGATTHNPMIYTGHMALVNAGSPSAQISMTVHIPAP